MIRTKVCRSRFSSTTDREELRSPEAVHINWSTTAIMNSLRIARAALRARPTAIRAPLQRRGYAEAVNDKASRRPDQPGGSIIAAFGLPRDRREKNSLLTFAIPNRSSSA